MKYFDAFQAAMKDLSELPGVIFLGQACEYPGHVLYKTLADVPMEKRLEMPVAEDMQMGITLGLALDGMIPVSIFPRHDFVICGLNQLVNHIDKIPQQAGRDDLHIIIRTAVGATVPLHPGDQHCQDYSGELKTMLHNVKVVELFTPEQVTLLYKTMMHEPGIYLTIEHMNLYND